tara:strand:+ start:507 stop:1034 length:528 start_codon:yes stop_codon:yes gene_type:complete
MGEVISDVESEKTSSDESEPVEVPITKHTNFQPISWQVWQPVPLALLSAFLSKLFWVEQVAPMLHLTSQWWVEYGVLIFSGSLLISLFSVCSLYWYNDWSERFQMIVAGALTIMFSIVLVLGGGILCWPFLIAAWVLISVVWGRYRLSPRRTGIWISIGGSVVLVLGGIMAHILL